MDFYDELLTIEKKLTTLGYKVSIPTSAQIMKQTNNLSRADFKKAYPDKKRRKLIWTNFDEIQKADGILVINNTKNGVDGYIGTNVLMEIGVAFYFKKKLFLWNPIAPDASFKEELDVFGVTVLNKNLSKISF